MKAIRLLALLSLGTVLLPAADVAPAKPPQAAAIPLFDDPVLARGKGVEVRRSQVDEMYAAFRANRSAAGQAIPPSQRPKIEADILDKLIATQVCLAHATPADKESGKKFAATFIAEQMKQVPSEESFKRQLLALGLTPEQFRAQVTEQAIVKAVLDRELKGKQTVTDADAKKFYDEHPKYFEQSEMVRVSHILLSTSDAASGRDLSPEERLKKRDLAAKLLARAKGGEDFASLVRQFSDDKIAAARDGEYLISRNERQYVITPEFEAAAFSLAVNQISDIVTTAYGFHILKGLEKIPAHTTPFAEAAPKIKETLLQEAVQKELPGYISNLRKDAGVELLKPDEK